MADEVHLQNVATRLLRAQNHGENEEDPHCTQQEKRNQALFVRAK
jgi:hypothetical protein